MDVHIFDEQDSIELSPSHIQAQVQHILEVENIQTKEIMIHFVSKQRITDLHGQFFDDPTPTDCISFPIDEDTLGEVFVCTDVAIEYAKEHSLDPKDEITLYMVHGILHLLGYDDLEESKRSIMRKKEKKCMESLEAHKLGMVSGHFS